MTTSILSELVSGVEGQIAGCKLSQEAEAFLSEKGIPSKRHENWKYTNIKRLFDNGLTVVNSEFSGHTPELNLTNTISIGLTNDALQISFQALMAWRFLWRMKRLNYLVQQTFIRRKN